MNEVKNNLPVKIEEQIQSSGMTNLSRAQEIAINYAPYLQQIDEQAEIVKGLKKGNPEHVAIAKRARLDLGKICSAVGVRKTEDKQTILIAGRFIDGLYNTVNGAGRLTQGEAKEIEDHAEMLEKAKKDKLRTIREKEIAVFDVNPGVGDIADMSTDVWGYYIAGLKKDKKDREESERKAEAERVNKLMIESLRWERAEEIKPYYDFFEEKEGQNLGEICQEDFDRILIDLKKKKSVHEKEQEKIRKENEQLKKEAELKIIADEKAEVERRRLAKIELGRLAKVEEARKAKVEKERLSHEAELKRVRDDRAKIQKALETRQEEARKAEQAEIDRQKIEADEKRKAELAPDKEKLTKWIEGMSIGIETKNLSQESEYIVFDIYKKHDAFKTWATEKVNKIK